MSVCVCVCACVGPSVALRSLHPSERDNTHTTTALESTPQRTLGARHRHDGHEKEHEGQDSPQLIPL